MSTYVSVNFYDASVWRGILLVGVLFVSLIVANVIKTRFFKKSLIPNSVLGGCILLVISTICFYTKGEYLFNLNVFSVDGSGISTLEALTFHCLGIGFVAMTLRPSESKSSKERSTEVLNSGVTTIVNYLIQAILGITITIIASKGIEGLAPGSGILLCFGYGQGTGQALNIGKNFDAAVGGGAYANMGLSLAALGFLVASIFGVIYLNRLRKTGKLASNVDSGFGVSMEEVQGKNEVPMNESVDKLSMQVALVLLCYCMAYGMMYVIGNLAGGLIGTIFGFNFIFGVLSAVIVKAVMNGLKKMGLLHHDYTNVYLLNRISGFAFDLMIVAGICAIQIDLIANYIGTILILAAVGAVATFFYVRFICHKLFPKYEHAQFFAFFGMLTGTASTGMVLLREADPNLKTPASDNLVYQNFPAIILGFPLLLVAGEVTTNAMDLSVTLKMLALLVAAFVVLNVFLFRSFIFKKKK